MARSFLVRQPYRRQPITRPRRRRFDRAKENVDCLRTIPRTCIHRTPSSRSRRRPARRSRCSYRLQTGRSRSSSVRGDDRVEADSRCGHDVPLLTGHGSLCPDFALIGPVLGYASQRPAASDCCAPDLGPASNDWRTIAPCTRGTFRVQWKGQGDRAFSARLNTMRPAASAGSIGRRDPRCGSVVQ